MGRNDATITSSHQVTGVISDKFSITCTLSSTLHVVGTIGIPTDIQGYPFYDGVTDVVPSVDTDQVLPTQYKQLNSNITVWKIPTYETSNNNGVTFIIGD